MSVCAQDRCKNGPRSGYSSSTRKNQRACRLLSLSLFSIFMLSKSSGLLRFQFSGSRRRDSSNALRVIAFALLFLFLSTVSVCQAPQRESEWVTIRIPAYGTFSTAPGAAALRFVSPRSGPFLRASVKNRCEIADSHESAADAVGVLDFPRRSFVQIAGPASRPPSLSLSCRV